MDDKPPTALQRLWEPTGPAARQPRLGLSLERVVDAAVALADKDGLEAVSMARVAQRLGFTTMSLYRYVASKDELLLFMHDAAWQPVAPLDLPVDGWRPRVEHWCRQMRTAMQRHPWLEQIRTNERVGTPSQLTWLDRGLAALADTPLSEYEKTQVLLALNGHVFYEARTVADFERAAKAGGTHMVAAAGERAQMMTAFADPGRFPALSRAVEGGAFEGIAIGPTFDFDAMFTFGLDLILDGVAALMTRNTQE